MARIIYRPNITIVVYCGHKTSKQQQSRVFLVHLVQIFVILLGSYLGRKDKTNAHQIFCGVFLFVAFSRYI